MVPELGGKRKYILLLLLNIYREGKKGELKVGGGVDGERDVETGGCM